MLELVHRIGKKGEYRCSCGGSLIAFAGNVKAGRTTRCHACQKAWRSIPQAIDLSGRTFGRLTVLGRKPNTAKKPKWICTCACGSEAVVCGSHLKNGHTKSCGCLAVEVAIERNTTHGMKDTKIYRIWAAMLRRCRNKNSPAYKWYGARGISVCERWLSFENFYADMGHPPEGLEIDRIDNDGNYEPTNCRWTTHKQNCNNRRKAVRVGGVALV